MCRKKPPPECQSSESDVVYMRAFMCVRGLRAVAVAGGAAAVAAGLYLSLFSVQGRSSEETTEADCQSAAPEMGNTLERHFALIWVSDI